jgi:hypothetical protein
MAIPMEMRMVAVSIVLVTMGTLLYAAMSSFSGMLGWLVGWLLLGWIGPCWFLLLFLVKM